MPFRLPRRGLAQIAALIVILLIDRVVSPQFFDLRLQDGRLFGSLIDVFNRGAPVALLSLGMVLVIATGGIDLSVGAVMAISGAIAASLADSYAWPVAVSAALGVGLLCGLWNGILVAVLGIQPMISAGYMWCGLCAALAGIIAAADIMGADANNAGLWLELDAILAVVIGGTSLFGGRFSLVLAVCGALIIQAMNTGILLSGYPPEFNLVVKAVVVLVVLLLQSPRFANAGAVLGRARQ